MPEQRETNHFESGRATAPPSIYYSSHIAIASKDCAQNTAETSTISAGSSSEASSKSPLYTENCNNFDHQITHSCPSYTSEYNLYSGSNTYQPTTSKTNVTNFSYQSGHYSTEYFSSPSTQSTSFPPLNNFPLFTSCNSSNNNNNNSNKNINNNINNSNSNNCHLEFIPNTKTSPKCPEDFFTASETSNFHLAQHLTSTSLTCSKASKLSPIPSPKNISHSSSSLLPTNTQLKYFQNKDSVDFLGKDLKVRKASKEDALEDLQIFCKNGTKINSSEETNQTLMTDSLLHLLQKKNSKDSLPHELGDLSSILVSITTKNKAEEVSGLKTKENKEEYKLMNDFLAKILSEKEEKRFKSLDEKKKALHKESFDNLSNDLDERKIKRDAMSHYQEDKNHQKRSSNYGDYNQWEYFGQQDIQSSNNHSRRGHFSFGGTSQQHPVTWNPMGIGMPRQSNPYYANPHSHMMPAHAHSDYRYNQWNNPNHKNIPNVHNAHSQNTILPQSKVDVKHHSDIANSVQDFGLPIGATSEFSKYRAPSRELMHRAPSNLAEKSARTGIHSDHLPSIPPSIRNSSTIRTPPISNHPKTVINNPLSDLQMLVTNQDGENLPQKADNFQQESVDLSAHSEVSKLKVNLEDKPLNGSNKDIKEFRSPVSVIQIQSKLLKGDLKESEKPVELTAKCTERSAETTVPPSLGRNDIEKTIASNKSVVESAKETTQKENVKSEEPTKTSVIVGKNEESSHEDTKSERDIPKVIENKENVKDEKHSPVKENKEVNKKVEERVSEADNPKVINEGVKEKDEKNNQPSEVVQVESSKDLLKKCSENVDSSRNCKRKAEDEKISGENKKVLLEVESQLEEIFEGVEGENSDLPTVTSTSTEMKPLVNEIIKKTPKKKPSRKSRIGRLSSGQSSGSERSLHCKKYKSSLSKDEGKKKLKKNLCDVMDRRGPFLHVEGSRESPASVILVNFPKGDDEDEKEKNSAKKQILNSSRTKHHNELDYRGRSRNGFYSSTLSARYDAHTTDHTWVCVFCKKGPHFNAMGDLFGPYIISKDENNISFGDFSGDEKDISDAQKRGGRNKKSIRSNNMVEHFQKMYRKLRRTQSTESCLIGMTVISDNHVDQLRYEVWVHEQCAVWSPNVFLIGSRIIGMQEAIWCSVKTVCSKCGIPGANLGCVYRNCPNRSHYHCAKESGWSLEQESFISTCHIHKLRS